MAGNEANDTVDDGSRDARDSREHDTQGCEGDSSQGVSRGAELEEGWGNVGLYGCLVVGFAALPALRALLLHSSFVWESAFLIASAVGGSMAGALGAALASRRSDCRLFRYSRREGIRRGAEWGACTALVLANISTHRHVGPVDASGGLFVGSLVGLVGGLYRQFLSPAERAFGRATKLLRRGDVTAARAAVEEYVEQAEKDPLRAARLPVAEAFLAGTRETLDVFMELEAAEAPGGRGTEPEAAPAPAGRGTELEAAARPGCEPIAPRGRE